MEWQWRRISYESGQSSLEDNNIKEWGNNIVNNLDPDNACNITDNIQLAIRENYN